MMDSIRSVEPVGYSTRTWLPLFGVLLAMAIVAGGCTADEGSSPSEDGPSPAAPTSSAVVTSTNSPPRASFGFFVGCDNCGFAPRTFLDRCAFLRGDDHPSTRRTVQGVDTARRRRRADGPYRAAGCRSVRVHRTGSGVCGPRGCERGDGDQRSWRPRQQTIRLPGAAVSGPADGVGRDRCRQPGQQSRQILRLVGSGGHRRSAGRGGRRSDRRRSHRCRGLPLPGASNGGGCERRVRGSVDDRPLGFPRRSRLSRYRVGPSSVPNRRQRPECCRRGRRRDRLGPLGHRAHHLPQQGATGLCQGVARCRR